MKKIPELLLNYGAQYTNGKVINSWNFYLKNPYSDKAFLAYLMAHRQDPTKTFSDWYIHGVYRVKRNSKKPLYVVEVYDGIKNKGFKPGCLYIVDSEGNHQKTIMEERVMSDLLVPYDGSYQDGFKYIYITQEKIDKGEIIDLPDINHDSFADIPTERWEDANRSTAVYLTSTGSIRCVFRFRPYDHIASLSGNVEKGHLYIKRLSESEPTMSVMLQPMKQRYDDNGRETGYSIDLRKPSHILTTYNWNQEAGTFTGPEEAPDDLWFVETHQ